MLAEFLALQELGLDAPASRIGDGLPAQAAAAGFKAFRTASIPDGDVERIRGTNSPEIFIERRGDDFPMSATIRRPQNRAYPADNPADLIGRSGPGQQVDENPAGLTRPGRAAIFGEFNEATAADAPENAGTRRGEQTRIGDHRGAVRGAGAGEL